MTRSHPRLLSITLCIFAAACGGSGGGASPTPDASDGASDGASGNSDTGRVDSSTPPSDADTAGDAPGEADSPAVDSGDADAGRPVVPDWPAPDCTANTAPLPTPHRATAAPSLPLLRVDGTDVVDPDGQPVALRGVNFGTWLMIESWMAGLGQLDEGDLIDALEAKADELGVGEEFRAARTSNGIDFLLTTRGHRVLVREWRQHMVANAEEGSLRAVLELWAWFDEQPWVFEEESLWAWLEHRFGADRAEDLRVAWGRNFITERDFEWVAELGLNAVRIPLFFGNLEEETEDGVGWRAEGWGRLGFALDQAREHGLYLIIDLHGAPGGQSAEWHAGLANGGALFSDPACLARTERLWEALATFVGDDPHVAALDLINEPIGSRSGRDWARVHQALYDAVRRVTTTHIVMAEDGYRGRRHVSGPAESGWTNAMFSVHVYPESPSADQYAIDIDDALLEWGEVWEERFASPLLLGEFNAEMGADEGPSAMDRALAVMNGRGVHWTIWTWKFWSDDSVWGVIAPRDGGARINLRDAGFEEIRAAFEGLRSEHFSANADYAAALRARAADAVRPLSLVD